VRNLVRASRRPGSTSATAASRSSCGCGGDREAIEDIRELVVNPGGERPIPLSAVASVQLGEGPSEVRRVDGRGWRWCTPTSALGRSATPWTPSTASCAQAEILAGGHEFTITGQNEEWQRSRAACGSRSGSPSSSST
jgi:Cu/Ag efflux pump CusA